MMLDKGVKMILEYFIFTFVVSLVFIYFIVYYGARRRCTYQTIAKCTKKLTGTVPGAIIHNYVFFNYTYKGKVYENTPVDIFRKMPTEFVEGLTYTIYVNPRNPKEFKCDTVKLNRWEKISKIMGWYIIFHILLVIFLLAIAILV